MARKKSDQAKAELAYARSEAWALSAPGTPYGVTQPVMVPAVKAADDTPPPQLRDQSTMPRVNSRARTITKGDGN